MSQGNREANKRLQPMAASANMWPSWLNRSRQTAAFTMAVKSASSRPMVRDQTSPPREIMVFEIIRERMPSAKYTDEACVGKIQGVVIVQLTIDREGRAGEPTAVRGLPGGLTESAIEALRGSEFWPALLCGAPVPVHTTTTVNFELPHTRG